MLRKRYTVVVVGQGGLALSQRSEVSRHRSERDARAAAEEARDRLSVMHGDRAGHYRVVVERDGMALPGPDEQMNRPVFADMPPAQPALPEGESVRVIRHEPGAGETPRGQEPLFADLDAAEERDLEALLEDEPLERAQRRPAERRPLRLPAFDDIPSGRVPDDVLRKFEEAIAREERRRTQRPPTGFDGAG